MNTIYKSIALEAALLSVTLALQAEIQSEGETVTADVQASTLDRLKVTLVSPNVSGARDLVASGNATIEGNEIAVNLENLAFGTHRLVVSARFGTQIRTLYALDISVPQAELPNETQEYEDEAIVVSTYGDGGGGGEFPTDYAKQGDDPTATLTDAQAYAQAAAEDAAAAKTAAQSLTSLDSDINAGKTAIAQAVTAKGVPTSPTDTMLQMATNVTQIAQAPISINGGEMYAKQLYGSLTTPNYWNLYEVMAQLLSDGRLNNYGGILLAEYYKGYDSLALSGAGAGGAYVVSDVDGNGNFIRYTEDTTHTWSTANDGRGNRWVAYCFAEEYHDFQITDTNTSPRSMFIGRKVGNITFLTNGRTSEVVVPDGNFLKSFNSGSYSQSYGKKITFRNLLEQNSVILTAPQWAEYEAIYFSCDNITNTLVKGNGNGITVSSCIIKANNIISNNTTNYFLSNTGCQYLSITAEKINITSYGLLHSGYGSYGTIILNVEDFPSAVLVYVGNCNILSIGYISNDKAKSVTIKNGTGSINIVELQNGYCKNINISDIVRGFMTEANIYAYILQRLKQDEPDCGDGVTITLGQTNLDKLTSQESIDLLDALTNTYGYTFA